MRRLLLLIFLPSLVMAAEAPPSPEHLSLAAAVDWARLHNRDVQVARRAVEAAESALEMAAGRPNPTLSINTTAINLGSGIGGGGLRDKQVDSVLRLDQTFERGNKRELRMAQGQTALEAAKADLADTERQQLLAVRLAYWDLRLAAERLDLMRESAGLMETTLSRNALRLAAGDIARADLERIRVDALRAQADARAAQGDLKRARLTLAQLLAIESLADRIVAVDEWPMPALPASLAADRPGQRADVRAAALRVEAAAQGKALAESLQTRDVTLGVQFEHYPPDGRRMIGFGLSLPLFTGYDYRGEIRRAWSDWSLAQESLERVRSGALAEVDRLGEELSSAAERAKLYRDAILPAARKSAQAAELAYSQGAASVLDLLDARRTLRATEGDAAAAQADFAKAQASLAAAREMDMRP